MPDPPSLPAQRPDALGYDVTLSLAERRRTGAWYTPAPLVDHVVRRTLGSLRVGRYVRVLDPACGDGRFLVAAAAMIRAAGAIPVLTGVDIDLAGLRAARRSGASTLAMIDVFAGIEAIEDDALAHDWGERRFDVIVGNPPFLSQLASATARTGRSRFGGGPYADAAADFLGLALHLADPERGRVGLVLPTSLLTARDAAPIRRAITNVAALRWFWSSAEAMFDASVRTCAIGFAVSGKRGAIERSGDADFVAMRSIDPPQVATANDHWGWLIADTHGLPLVPAIATHGVLGDHAHVTANFRDQYYGLVGAVSDTADGPPLITTGLIDVGCCHWGRRPTRFAKQRFEAPRVDRTHLPPFMQRWVDRCLVPKILLATQTSVLEAVVDESGAWLPAVPVIRVVPNQGEMLWPIAAVLTSPLASLLIAEQSVGSGLSAATVRVSQRTLGQLPWPAGNLDAAVGALRAGDVRTCGRMVDAAYGVADPLLFEWWRRRIGPDA